MNFIWENLFKRPKKKDELRQALRENILFQDLSDRELRFLAELIHVRSFHSNEPIFRQGEMGVGMYIVVKGRVEIFVNDEATAPDEVKQIYITQLVPGDFFGELSLVEDPSRRTATAIAREETQLIGFFRPDLTQVLARNPLLGIKILSRLAEVLGRRLKETTESASRLQRTIKELRSNNAVGPAQ